MHPTPDHSDAASVRDGDENDEHRPEAQAERDAAMRSYVADTTVRFTVNVHDPGAIERVTEAGGDEWRSQFYGLRTAEQVIEHWVYNYLCNGVTEVSRLDGWADLAPGAVTFSTEFSDLELVEPKEADRAY